MDGEGSAAAEADVTEASTAPFALVLAILPNVADQSVHPLLSMFTPFIKIHRNSFKTSNSS